MRSTGEFSEPGPGYLGRRESIATLGDDSGTGVEYIASRWTYLVLNLGVIDNKILKITLNVKVYTS